MKILSAVMLTAGATVAAATDGALKFLVMGDWGGSESKPYTTSGEIATAKGMGEVGAAVNSKFALALGDNFYSHGIGTDEHDQRFKSTFEDVFTADALKAEDYFRVVAGNHDHHGNVTAQIAYSAHSKRWSFPSLYYDFTEKAPDGATVQVVYIDTVVLAGDSAHPLTGEELPGHAYPGPADVAAAQTQMEWLEKTLAASTADYLIVAGHYPVWSICEHGPTTSLVDNVKPLLEKYHVTAYLNGHDHCAEHINEGKGVDYHVIGSAHGWDTSTAHASAIPKNSLKFHPKNGIGGFALVSANKTALLVTHMSAAGDALYVAPARAPRGPPTPAPPTPPTPAPAPASWDCHTGHNFKNSARLQDVDHKDTKYSLKSCQARCASTKDCAVCAYHSSTNHCHTYAGTGLTKKAFDDDLEGDASRESCGLNLK